MTAERTVTIKPRNWESAGPVDVTLTLVESQWGDHYEVRHDGVLIGAVQKYQGSHDRKISGTRLRSSGKRKTLWAGTPPEGRTDYWREHDSRADAIRALLTEAGVRW